MIHSPSQTTSNSFSQAQEEQGVDYTIQCIDGRLIQYTFLKMLGTDQNNNQTVVLNSKRQVELIKFKSETVYPSTCVPNHLYALKKINASNETELKNLQREVEILKELSNAQCHHIIRYIDSFAKKSKKGVISMCIIMEYADAGNLESLLRDQFYTRLMHLERVAMASESSQKSKLLHSDLITTQQIVEWCNNLVDTLIFLHDRPQPIIHRDLKPSNILFQTETSVPTGQPIKVLKICDFGLARILEDSYASSYAGSRRFVAPEIARGQKYSYEVDIYSLGVVIFQLLLGVDENSLVDVEHELKRNPQFISNALSHVPTELKLLAQVCCAACSLDPVKRPNAKEIKELLQGKRSHLETVTSASIRHERVSNWNIRNEKGRQFWICQFGTEQTVTWIRFFDAYRNFLSDQKSFARIHFSDSEKRGLKKIVSILSTADGESEVVTCFSFDNAIDTCGFPFDKSILNGLDRFEVHSHNTSSSSSANPSNDASASSSLLMIQSLTPTVYETVRKKYFEDILKFEAQIFDPVSNSVLDITKHCVNLPMRMHEHWSDINWEQQESSLTLQHLITIEQITSSMDQPKLFIMGKSASGKTIMMKKLLINYAAMALKQLETGMVNTIVVPIWIPVVNLVDAIPSQTMHQELSPLAWFQILLRASVNPWIPLGHSNEMQHFLLYAFVQRCCVLLFDGLDECQHKDKIEQMIYQLHKFPSIKGIIISSRCDDAEEQELWMQEEQFFLKEFKPVLLLPLDLELKKQVAQWRGIQMDQDEQFNQLLKEYPDLSSSPLLLSMMIEEYKQHSIISNSNTATTKSIKVYLYEKATDTILQKYWKSKLESKSEEKILLLLIQLAKEMHEKKFTEFNREVDFVPKELWQIMGEDLETNQFPLIVKSLHRNTFKFIHLSFQEYFTSIAWSNDHESSLIKKVKIVKSKSKPSFEWDKLKLQSVVLDVWFRECLLFTSGQLSPQELEQMIQILLETFPGFAIIQKLVLRMVKERPQSQFTQQLEQKIRVQNHVQMMIKGLGEPNYALREYAVQLLQNHSKEAAPYVQLICSYFSTNYEEAIQDCARRVLESIPITNPSIPLELLLQIAKTKPSQVLLKTIQFLCTTNRECKQLVCSKLLEWIAGNKLWSHHSTIRSHSIQLLLQFIKEDPSLISMVVHASMDILHKSHDTQVRYCAYKLLRDGLPSTHSLCTQVIQFCKKTILYYQEQQQQETITIHDLEETIQILIKIVDSYEQGPIPLAFQLFNKFQSSDTIRFYALQLIYHLAKHGDVWVLQKMLPYVTMDSNQLSNENREMVVKILAKIGRENKGVMKAVWNSLHALSWSERESAARIILHFVPTSFLQAATKLGCYITEEEYEIREAAMKTLQKGMEEHFSTDLDCILCFLRYMEQCKEETNQELIMQRCMNHWLLEEKKPWLKECSVFIMKQLLQQQSNHIIHSQWQWIMNQYLDHLFANRNCLYSFEILENIQLLCKAWQSQQFVTISIEELDTIHHFCSTLLQNLNRWKRKRIITAALDVLVSIADAVPTHLIQQIFDQHLLVEDLYWIAHEENSIQYAMIQFVNKAVYPKSVTVVDHILFILQCNKVQLQSREWYQSERAISALLHLIYLLTGKSEDISIEKNFVIYLLFYLCHDNINVALQAGIGLKNVIQKNLSSLLQTTSLDFQVSTLSKMNQYLSHSNAHVRLSAATACQGLILLWDMFFDEFLSSTTVVVSHGTKKHSTNGSGNTSPNTPPLTAVSSNSDLSKPPATVIAAPFMLKNMTAQFNKQRDEVYSKLYLALQDEDEQVREAALNALEQPEGTKWCQIDLLLKMCDHVKYHYHNIVRHVRNRRKQDQHRWIPPELFLKKLKKTKTIESDFILMELL